MSRFGRGVHRAQSECLRPVAQQGRGNRPRRGCVRGRGQAAPFARSGAGAASVTAGRDALCQGARRRSRLDTQDLPAEGDRSRAPRSATCPPGTRRQSEQGTGSPRLLVPASAQGAARCATVGAVAFPPRRPPVGARQLPASGSEDAEGGGSAGALRGWTWRDLRQRGQCRSATGHAELAARHLPPSGKPECVRLAQGGPVAGDMRRNFRRGRGPAAENPNGQASHGLAKSGGQ